MSPALLAVLLSSCASVATSPAWTGGGLAEHLPAKAAQEDRAAEEERKRIASQPTEVGARHILVAYRKSERASESVTRTKDEARARATECLLKLREGAAFGDLAKEYSDEPGAGERGGDLGVFSRSQMVKPFAEAAFALKKGEVSELVETPFGFHIIQRTE